MCRAAALHRSNPLSGFVLFPSCPASSLSPSPHSSDPFPRRPPQRGRPVVLPARWIGKLAPPALFGAWPPSPRQHVSLTSRPEKAIFGRDYRRPMPFPFLHASRLRGLATDAGWTLECQGTSQPEGTLQSSQHLCPLTPPPMFNDTPYVQLPPPGWMKRPNLSEVWPNFCPGQNLWPKNPLKLGPNAFF